MAESIQPTIKANNYGEMLAAVLNLELVSYEEQGAYSGSWLAVLKDKAKSGYTEEIEIPERLFYLTGTFGSCSGCDFLEDVKDKDGNIPLDEALNFCSDFKPVFVVPASSPLKIEWRSEGYSFGHFQLII